MWKRAISSGASFACFSFLTSFMCFFSYFILFLLSSPPHHDFILLVSRLPLDFQSYFSSLASLCSAFRHRPLSTTHPSPFPRLFPPLPPSPPSSSLGRLPFPICHWRRHLTNPLRRPDSLCWRRHASDDTGALTCLACVSCRSFSSSRGEWARSCRTCWRRDGEMFGCRDCNRSRRLPLNAGFLLIAAPHFRGMTVGKGVIR